MCIVPETLKQIWMAVSETDHGLWGFHFCQLQAKKHAQQVQHCKQKKYVHNCIAKKHVQTGLHCSNQQA
jgi:hypothetical protein